MKSVSAVVLIGMRSPLRDGRALVARVENPSAIFESDEAPRIAPSLDELDLGGNGIRAMAFIPVLGAYLLIGAHPSSTGRDGRLTSPRAKRHPGTRTRQEA